MMKKFKFTIVLAIISAVVFLHINVSTLSVSDAEIHLAENGKGYTVSGKILPVYKVYKGYEYKIENGAAIIKLKSSFGLFGQKDFEFKISDCKYVYLADDKTRKEVEQEK